MANGAGTVINHMQKQKKKKNENKFNPYLEPYEKIKSKWNTGLNINLNQ